ncbi:MAG: PD-(D/E)XK nuclease family protein, partial [Clostridia bacterium]|nr:PD-(D/E)XK nuclease family protein [Clostridia bacterium]
LENYVSSWNINGKRWTDGIEWHMNPDGYTEKISPEGSIILNRANAVREKIVPHLTKFFESFGGTTVSEITRALYGFLNDLKVKEQIEAKASEYRSVGNIDEEKELVQLWNILINTLDVIVELAGDLKVNGEEYVTVISMILGKINIGTIPATIDQVILGSASSLRTNCVPHVFMLGVNEGVFPMSSEENLLFSDNEKNILKTVDIDFLPLTDEQSADELYWFYKSISRAKETLTLTYCDSDLKGESKKISVAGSRVDYLLGKESIKYADIPMIDKVEGKSIAVKTFALNRETELGQALLNYFNKDDKMSDIVKAFDTPLVAGKSDIDEELARKVYKGDLQTSQSRLESYVNCSFDYHCKHILRLGEKKTAEFRFNNIGNFIHAILERFMAAITDEDGFHADIEDGKVVELVDEVVNEYISSIFGNLNEHSARLMQLLNRLRRTTLLLVRNILAEFRQSDFVPTFFELPIYNDKEGGISPYEIELEDGSKLLLHGFVDRVDTYKKGKDVYVRIVDYKSGDKKFSFNDIEKGLNIQMLLYLFAVWNTKEEWFKERIKCEGEILPAGILYHSAQAPLMDVSNESELDSVYDKALKSISKSGLLLRDIDVLKAMDKEMKGLYIPFKTNKDGSLAKTDYLITIEEFGNLANRIDGILKNIGKNIKTGKVEAKPIEEDSQESPCRYCRMKPICRRTEKGEEE